MMMQTNAVEPTKTAPHRALSNLHWEEMFHVLQKLLDNGEVNFESKEFWLVTPIARVNEWLAYNKIEMKRPNRQADPRWQERRQRLEAVGFSF